MVEPTNQQMETILRLAKKIAPKFAFDIYDAEDMIHEAVMLGIECVSRYDPERGAFEHFCARHINNRLRTFVRKYSAKAEPDVPTSSLEHIHWNRSFGDKKRMQEAISLDLVQDELLGDKPPEDILTLSEIVTIIDCELPVEYRADYIRILNNVAVPKGRRNKIYEVIRQILERNGYTNYETW